MSSFKPRGKRGLQKFCAPGYSKSTKRPHHLQAARPYFFSLSLLKCPWLFHLMTKTHLLLFELCPPLTSLTSSHHPLLLSRKGRENAPRAPSPSHIPFLQFLPSLGDTSGERLGQEALSLASGSLVQGHSHRTDPFLSSNRMQVSIH